MRELLGLFGHREYGGPELSLGPEAEWDLCQVLRGGACSVRGGDWESWVRGRAHELGL